ncbi:MAG: DUF1579 family protein [Acidobacteriota bacterium]
MSDEQAVHGPQDFAAMAAPTAEHSLLEPFVGSFMAEVKIWMGPGDPMVSTGRMTNTMDLGGRFLRQVYTGDPGEGPFPGFEGRGFWGYNKTDQRFEGFWIDIASTMMQIEYGQVDDSGRVWNMKSTMTDPRSGQPVARRSVITLIDRDHHSMEMYWHAPQGEVKGMEIQYARKP